MQDFSQRLLKTSSFSPLQRMVIFFFIFLSFSRFQSVTPSFLRPVQNANEHKGIIHDAPQTQPTECLRIAAPLQSDLRSTFYLSSSFLSFFFLFWVF